MMSLKSAKIKPLSYLLTKFLEKEVNLNTSKNCFLLGAGCSITSNIRSGGGVMELCRQLSFAKHHENGHSLGTMNHTNFTRFVNLVERFVKDNKSDFNKFVTNTESQFENQITDEEVLLKIPENLKIETDLELVKKFKPLVIEDNLYGNWFEHYSEDPRERQKLIELLIEECKVSGEYILFANLIKSKHINTVFTTNFDDLLNEALWLFTGKKARVYSHNEVVKYLSFSSEKPNIIKLHGDYLFENIKNIGQETFELEDNMKLKFKEALNQLDLIVIGYGGADKSIMSHLENLKKDRAFGLIWCGSDENQLHWRVINLINETPNSYFIKTDNFSELTFNLWNVADVSPVNVLEIAKGNQKLLDEHLLDLDRKIGNTSGISTPDKEKISDAFEATKLHSKAYSLDYGDEEDLEKALELYTEAIKLNPKYVAAYINRGVLYSNKLNAPEKAYSDYIKALELDPNNGLAHYNIGHVMENLNMFDESIVHYNLALDFKGHDEAIIFNNIAVVYRKMKNYDKAKSYLQKAMDSDPNLGNTYGTLAFIYSDLGDDDNFYKFLETAIQKGCLVLKYIDEKPFDKYRDTKKLNDLFKKYGIIR